MLERLQKIISAAGVASRRAAEALIAEGRVRVNGKVVTELGSKADASRDHIKVDGKLINPSQPMTYIMLNKPAGYVTTMSDPEGRPTVQDLMKGVKVRVYPVGRLDYNTEGMLILTNDGGFAHVITHPQHELPKTYLAKIKGILDEKAIESLETGVFLDDGKTAPAKIKKVRKEEANSWVEITIHEGRKRQVRRMFDRVGRSVIKLKRIKTGNLILGDLPEGSFRYLTHDEVQGLKELAQQADIRSRKPEVTRQKRETKDGERLSTERRQEPRVGQREPGQQKRAHKGKPDVRPWRAAESVGESRRGTTYRLGETGESAPKRTYGSKSTEGRGTGTYTRGRAKAGSWAPRKTGAGKKPDVRPWSTATSGGESRRETRGGQRYGAQSSGGKAGASRNRGFDRGPQGEVRRPSSGPRPNRSSRPTGKRPGQGARPSARSGGPKTGGRGPRR